MPVNSAGSEGSPPRVSLMLRLLHDAYATAVEAELATAGFGDLSGGRAKVLPFVPDSGIAVGRLANRVGVRKQSVAQMVEQLERDGFIRSEPNPEDARSRLVFLTDRGAQAQPAAILAGDCVERAWADATSQKLVEQLRTNLRTLLEAIGENRQH